MAGPKRRTLLERADALLELGPPLFALAVIGLGLETLVCARRVGWAPATMSFLYFLGSQRFPGWLERGCRYLLAVALLVFEVDHFLALAFIATLLPAWIPWNAWGGFWTSALTRPGGLVPRQPAAT